MYNPYQNQNQGNAFPQGNNYYQQGQAMQQPMQQQQQQQQQQPQPQVQMNASNYMGMGTQSTGYNPSLQQGVNQPYGNSGNLTQPQQNSMGNLGMNSTSMQSQPTTSYYQSNNPAPTSNLQNTGMGVNNYQSQPIQQTQTLSAMQPIQQQGTGYYNNSTSAVATPGINQQTGMQSLQSQGTGYFPNPAQGVTPTIPSQVQPMQPLQNQNSAQLQPLQPQQTGFYAQQYQMPLEPLKPTATGFVNSFANNGLNNDIKIPAIRLSFITAKDQAKFETLFRASVQPGSNTITGKGCRSILMKSGLAPSQLAKIWTLCDTSKAGELLFPEFALAMHLVNDVLQGDQIPYELDSKTKNEVNSFIDAINLSIASNTTTSTSKTPFDELMSGAIPMQTTGMIPQTSFGMPAQPTGGLMPQSTGFIPQTSFGLPPQLTGGLMPQVTGGMQTNTMMPQNTFNAPLQNQVTGGGMGGAPIQAQITGGFVPQPQPQQLAAQQTGPMGMPTLTFGQGGLTNQVTGFQQQNQPPMGLQPQATGYLPPSNFTPTVPLVAQKTGFGNNEIYAQSNFTRTLTTQMNQQQEDNDTISPEEKSLFYKIFETYDNNNTGLIDSPTAVEIFRKSGLNRSDLEHIWNLCDTNNSGQLNKQEFALGMHLVYRKLNNQPIPSRLPASLVPSSNRILDNLKTQLKSSDNGLNSSGSKINGLGYKNDDNENSLPTFRNRRKNFSTTATASTDLSPTVDSKGSPSVAEASQKYPDISATDITSTTPSPPAVNETELAPAKSTQPAIETSTLAEDLKRITEIRYELESLQLPPITGNTQVSHDLQKRFETIVNTVPQLFSEIAEVNNKITDAKIELVNLRAGTAIEGTGPNGEITENDKKKAKSRALLKARMAALTGKPNDNAEDDDNSKENAEELGNIRKESIKNQEIIKDIRSSISDISSSLKSTFTGKNIYDDGEEFEKWEFGSGLEKEVRNFIRDLNRGNLLDQASNAQSTSTSTTKSEPQSLNDRSAYLKEQAQKRMKERLAKFGINKRGDRSRSNTSESIKTPFEVEEKPVESPRVEQSLNNNYGQEPQVNHNSNNGIADEDEDEEERKLREKLENLKLKKKADKEKRLAELRKQIEEAEASSDEEEPVVTKTINLNNISTQAKSQLPSQTTSSYTQQNVNATTALPAPINEPVSKPNPFFKQDSTSTSSSFDARAAELQRKSQRGFDEDKDSDGWSDDEPEGKPQIENVQVTSSIPIVTSNVPVPEQSAPVPLAPPPPQMQESVPAVPLAPPIPQIQESVPAVPLAPPIPQMQEQGSAVPLAPPIPQMQEQSTVVPLAPPIPQMQEQSTVVPVAPPIPQATVQISDVPMAPQIVGEPSYNEVDNEVDNDDVLSIPDSVDSGDEGGPMPISSIPPPPPLP
ncbi:similar to Saccharomyces cerevisiae YIR006C PAN1 Part of actin cytoskeleton-regulatory complex Pan1p-Sla1p-End3p, associates with actin patches on the cell cortex [Maudiozyma saulgeensis]|uniref:Actin cytoskeleton-regulatory complex protein PAN1 n=1 Tax=Maudiozyma saulgeensis TaxID=1789683 RepID=A0A1X7R3F9_9SACH|nr:similar to Saccharomyces cerevisiae YIR006C PAN1 Part of actin cytoskeleton-regulatory complex Pan1p-Sla1p-End3p, associates with actin patches on the cell cortex [Kazachstania saulgeensis]